jgi:hypothetical protein
MLLTLESSTLHYVFVLPFLVVGKVSIESNRDYLSKEHKLTPHVQQSKKKASNINIGVFLVKHPFIEWSLVAKWLRNGRLFL